MPIGPRAYRVAWAAARHRREVSQLRVRADVEALDKHAFRRVVELAVVGWEQVNPVASPVLGRHAVRGERWAAARRVFPHVSVPVGDPDEDVAARQVLDPAGFRIGTDAGHPRVRGGAGARRAEQGDRVIGEVRDAKLPGTVEARAGRCVVSRPGVERLDQHACTRVPPDRVVGYPGSRVEVLHRCENVTEGVGNVVCFSRSKWEHAAAGRSGGRDQDQGLGESREPPCNVRGIHLSSLPLAPGRVAVGLQFTRLARRNATEHLWVTWN